MKLNKKLIAVPAAALAAGLSLAACGSVKAPAAAPAAPHSVAGALTKPAPAKTTPAAAPAPTQAAALPKVATNNAITPGAQAVEPSAIYFSADGNGDLTRITWSSWTAHSAEGSGSINVNNCQPDCAMGTTVNVPVSVALSAPTSGSSPYFTSITLTDSSGNRNTYAAGSNGLMRNISNAMYIADMPPASAHTARSNGLLASAWFPGDTVIFTLDLSNSAGTNVPYTDTLTVDNGIITSSTSSPSS
jgi:hypothetical protein